MRNIRHILSNTTGLILLLLFFSCGPSGKYCSTVSSYGCPDGYRSLELKSDGTSMVCLNGYCVYGEWEEIDDGVKIKGLTKEFTKYNGTYRWSEHPNGCGPGCSDEVLEKGGDTWFPS